MNQAAEQVPPGCPRQPWSQQVAAVAHDMGAGLLDNVMETLLRQVGQALPACSPLPMTPSLMGLPRAKPCLSHQVLPAEGPRLLTFGFCLEPGHCCPHQRLEPAGTATDASWRVHLAYYCKAGSGAAHHSTCLQAAQDVLRLPEAASAFADSMLALSIMGCTGSHNAAQQLWQEQSHYYSEHMAATAAGKQHAMGAARTTLPPGRLLGAEAEQAGAGQSVSVLPALQQQAAALVGAAVDVPEGAARQLLEASQVQDRLQAQQAATVLQSPAPASVPTPAVPATAEQAAQGGSQTRGTTEGAPAGGQAALAQVLAVRQQALLGLAAHLAQCRAAAARHTSDSGQVAASRSMDVPGRLGSLIPRQAVPYSLAPEARLPLGTALEQPLSAEQAATLRRQLLPLEVHEGACMPASLPQPAQLTGTAQAGPQWQRQGLPAEYTFWQGGALQQQPVTALTDAAQQAGPASPLLCMAAVPQAGLLAAGTADGAICIWQMSTTGMQLQQHLSGVVQGPVLGEPPSLCKSGRWEGPELRAGCRPLSLELFRAVSGRHEQGACCLT